MLPDSQYSPERWRMDNSASPVNLSWTETVLRLYAENTQSREILKVRNYRHSKLQAVHTDHGKIGLVTGIEVFRSAGTLVIEVQVPSQQPGNEKSWVRTSRVIGQCARQFTPTETDHRNLEAVSSQQSMSCGRS